MRLRVLNCDLPSLEMYISLDMDCNSQKLLQNIPVDIDVLREASVVNNDTLAFIYVLVILHKRTSRTPC